MVEVTRRASPIILDAALGVCLAAFVILLALFLRDVALAGHVCMVPSPMEPTGPMLLAACLERVQGEGRRLCYEVPALVLAGGLIGTSLAR